jgi:hypothetical protein
MNLAQDAVDAILQKLSHGTEDDLWELLYGNARFSRSQLAVPLNLLGQLRSPTAGTAIRVLDAGYQEPFWMLILSIPWLSNGRFRPLLIAHEDGVPKLAGMVLPWNEIIPTFTQEQMANATRCAVWWTIKLKELTGSK